jgi:hypothetical protein
MNIQKAPCLPTDFLLDTNYIPFTRVPCGTGRYTTLSYNDPAKNLRILLLYSCYTMSTPNSSSMTSNASFGSRTNSNTSQTSFGNQRSTRVVSSSHRPQGLSASTKLLAKQLRQTERDLASQDRAQFLNGGLQWLMEQSIQVGPSGEPIRRRRGSLLTEQAVRVHNVVEGGRKSLVRENSNSSSNSEQSGELNAVKVDSDAELRIDAWVSQHMHEASDPNK